MLRELSTITAAAALLTADSDGYSVHVILGLCGKLKKAKKGHYRVHYDTTDISLSWEDGGAYYNPNCEDTSDVTQMWKENFPGKVEDKGVGPGTFNAVHEYEYSAPDRIEFWIPYEDLGVDLYVSEKILIWVHTNQAGVSDRVPNTNGEDYCAEPQHISEMIKIKLEHPY